MKNIVRSLLSFTLFLVIASCTMASEADLKIPDLHAGHFIYTIGSKNTLREKVETVKRLKIDIDVLKFIRKSIEADHAKGFMKDTEREDTLFGGMNIGWEVPGIFDCGMTVHKFTVKPVPKSE